MRRSLSRSGDRTWTGGKSANEETAVASAKPIPKRSDATSAAIEELFAELERDPTNEATTLVLADALAELGDERAELVLVQRAIAVAPKADRASFLVREAALIHALRIRLLGPKYAPRPDLTLRTRLGFARELGVFDQSTGDLAKILATALPSTDARLLESLHIAFEDEQVMGLGEVFRELAGHVAAPASLRRLVVGIAFENDRGDRIGDADNDDDAEDDDRGAPAEDLRLVVTMFPRLRELVLDLGAVPVRLPVLATKNLESLTWITPRLSAVELVPLASSILPGLRRFELWIGGVYGNDDGEMRDGEEPGDELDVLDSLPLRDLEPVLDMLDRCTHLQEVVFGHSHKLAELLQRLGGHAFVGRIARLGLSHVEIDDPDVLIDFMQANPGLGTLVLDRASASERVQAVLARRLGKRLVADWTNEALRFRYVTGYE